MRQIFLSVGSTGHGSESVFLIKIPATDKINNVTMEIDTLCSDITINCGNTLVSEANVAPAPTATNNAGNAQQISVVDDAISDTIPTFEVSLLVDIYS